MTQGAETQRLTPLVADLVAWIDAAPRPLNQVMDAWRTACPQTPVWETARDLGYLAREAVVGGASAVCVTRKGRRFLDAHGRSGPLEADRLRLRSATPADAAQLAAWQSRPHVRAVAGEEPWYDWDEELRRVTIGWREFLVAELVDDEGERPLGFVQIIDPAVEEHHYWGEIAPHLRALDMWVGEADALGCGFGSRMMQIALARCFAHPQVTAAIVDPFADHSRARNFYERQGFQPLGPRVMHGDAVFIYELRREDWAHRSA